LVFLLENIAAVLAPFVSFTEQQVQGKQYLDTYLRRCRLSLEQGQKIFNFFMSHPHPILPAVESKWHEQLLYFSPARFAPPAFGSRTKTHRLGLRGPINLIALKGRTTSPHMLRHPGIGVFDFLAEGNG